MFCPYCGKKMEDNQEVCLSCGKYVKNASKSSSNGGGVDDGNFVWGLIGFLVPIVGAVLYFMWKEQKPKNAKKAGMGALISVGINFVVSILSLIFQMALA